MAFHSWFICGLFSTLTLAISWCSLISISNNKLKSYFIIIIAWFYANYSIFWFFSQNESLEIWENSTKIVKFFENFAFTKVIIQLFSFLSYSQITYTLSLIAPILLWINPTLTLDNKLIKIGYCMILNNAYIYQATLDENSYYGKFIPSLCPILHLSFFHYLWSKHSQSFSSRRIATIEFWQILLVVLHGLTWFLFVLKWFYGDLQLGLYEILTMIFWFFADYTIAYFTFIFFISAFGELAQYIYNNSYIIRSKAKTLKQIKSFAAFELLGCFGLILANVVWYYAYNCLDYYLSFPWLINEGFIGTQVFAFTVWTSLSTSKKDEIITLNFRAFYLTVSVFRAIYL